jgi:hypothetical protein
VVWSRQVWADLSEKFLQPQGMNFFDAITLFPSEMRWYGEALLKFKSIELWPIETLFRCYHYEDQYRNARKSGESDEVLSHVYLGVCVQSNWHKELEYGAAKKSFLSCSRHKTPPSAPFSLVRVYSGRPPWTQSHFVT